MRLGKGALTSANPITPPARFASDEMPPGVNGSPIAEQIFICGGCRLFCDEYITGGGTLISATTFHDVVSSRHLTLTGFAPGEPFSITELFDFTQIAGLFRSLVWVEQS
jgi:hypothetical protein